MTRTTPTARAVALAAAAVLTLGLAACGADDGSHMDGSMMGGSSASADAADDHNQADVMFSTMMVPHHLQAIEMADLVPDRTQDPEVRDLAQRIRGAQQPEVDTMTAWLGSWGARPMDGHGGMEGHDGHSGMDGMMSEDEMVELGALRGAAFDRRWLEMMVEHHEGAVDMAQAVLRNGRHAGTRVLAGEIIESQQKEIDEMKGYLAD